MTVPEGAVQLASSSPELVPALTVNPVGADGAPGWPSTEADHAPSPSTLAARTCTR